MSSENRLSFVPIGSNPARPFGMEARYRACRLAAHVGLECRDEPLAGHPALLASMAYAWDPAWLRVMKDRPGTLLMLGDEPVMAHVPAGEDPRSTANALLRAGELPTYDRLAAETAELNYAERRKRNRPFVMALDPNDPEPVERAAYDACYKVVSDLLTLYLWRGSSFYLTRWAARAGLTPNLITAIGAILCVLTFILFWHGHYWLGSLSGFVFMVLDTVDGKLACCTGSSSKWANVFAKGIDLVHPPFWWWAWLHGLSSYGRPLEPVYATMVLFVILGGYVAQRIIEGLSIKRFGGMEIHAWRRLDSRFRLITARRNPNMVILVGSLLFSRPDVGIKLVAWWTLISLIFHAVRLAQMTERKARGEKVVSWLEA